MLGIFRLYVGAFFAVAFTGFALADGPCLRPVVAPIESCPRKQVEKIDHAALLQIIGGHETWAKSSGWDHPEMAGKANLCNYDLSGEDLHDRYLLAIDLRGAKLDNTKFDNTRLDGAQLQNAELCWTSMRKVMMKGADLTDAYLVGPDLTGGVLDGINLTNARVFGANFAETSFFNVKLDAAIFRPAGAPSKGKLTGIAGLLTVGFAPDPFVAQQSLEEQISGMILFRKDFQDSGLKNLERDATYVIERARTRNDISDDNSLVKLGGYARLVLFERTTEYGREPWRAIVIMLVVMAGLSPFYFFVLLILANRAGSHVGIFRYRPAGSLITVNGVPGVLANARVERLGGSWKSLIWHALYFSILSTFRMGWRELNLGTWIENMQSSDFQLRPKGWIRSVAGLQSLLSVYLLAIWALTEFGQPFE